MSILQLCRVWNSLFAAGVCAYAYIIAGHAVYIEATAAIFFLLSFANAHNDIVDFNVDKINRPDRPLPSGKISLKTAKIAAAVCLFLAIAFGFKFAWLFAIVGALCFVYNKYLKRFPLVGNFAVALLVTTPIAIPILDIGLPQLELFNLMFFAFTLTLAREITKDIEDIEGDRAMGLRTLPILINAQFSLILVFLCEIQCLVQLAMFKLPVFFAVLPCLLLSAFFACKKKIKLSQNMIKIAMVLGLVFFYIYHT
ncbi:MAG: UbiA family prenyltransferase [Fibromonadales bacterium]|nr:UbiA family prenyltransferase [Fibromonadales bacterium]